MNVLKSLFCVGCIVACASAASAQCVEILHKPCSTLTTIMTIECNSIDCFIDPALPPGPLFECPPNTGGSIVTNNYGDVTQPAPTGVKNPTDAGQVDCVYTQVCDTCDPYPQPDGRIK